MVSLFNFLKRIYTHRSMIKAMAFQEITKRYAGTLGGFVWSVLHPAMMILIYWFVFSVGFKVQPMRNMPFIVVFCSGLIPWTTFNESLMASTSAITGNPHLVSKTVFPTEILPVVHLVASLISHGIMLVILLILLLMNGIALSLWNLQFLYYLFALLVFSLGFGWFFSSVNVFYRDIAQILGIVLNMWFWMTPIVWHIDLLPQRYQSFIKFNPMYYIVEGYRSSFVYHFPFWHRGPLGIYFWVVCLFSFIVGGVVFKKLKPEFPEAL